MNIEKDLKKDGITVIKPLDTLSITLIAKYVAEKLMSAFPFYGFNYEKLFIKINNIPMYIAKIPHCVGDANYFYKNSSIYFREGLSIDSMKRCAIHEFVHAYQEVKDKGNVLYKLGLCDFTGFKIKGMALNEGAVQLIASRALKTGTETVNYYDIEFATNSPCYYPVICNLVNQMAYVVGENVLFDSTFNSNNTFVKSFINVTSEKTFGTIQTNLDKILEIEEKIAILSSKLENEVLSEKNVTYISLKIGKYKELIKRTFIETQELIITSYFNKYVQNLHSEQEIEDFRKKLYNYRDLIGITEKYSFFNDYYINMMSILDEKYEELTNIELALLPYKRSIMQILFEKIYAITGVNKIRNSQTIKGRF